MVDKCPKCGETLIKRTIQKRLGLGSIDFPVADICPKCNWSNDLTGAGDIVAKPLAPEAEAKLEKKPEVMRYAPEKPNPILERITPVRGDTKQVLEKTKPRPSASKKRVLDMNRVITFALAFLVIMGIAWAFIPKGNEPTASIQPASTPGPTPGVTASTVTATPASQVTYTGKNITVKIDRDRGFYVPAQSNLKIKAGDGVIWVNEGTYSLTLISRDGLFGDYLMDNDKRKTHIFTNTGTFTFDIAVQDVKKFSGTVTVEP